MKKKTKFLSMLCSCTLIVSCITSSLQFSISADDNISADDTAMNMKISDELKDVMLSADKDELIPIFIFRKPIPENEINQMVLSETGMRADLYEDVENFENIIVPQVTDRIIEQLGTVAANTVNTSTEMSPIDTAISEEADRYTVARRAIVKREYVSSNDKFISTYIPKGRKMYYTGQYTSNMATEATVNEIIELAKLSDVTNLGFYQDYIMSSEVAIALPQVNADSVDGTKSTVYNSGAGYKGSGIKIGIIEAEGGKYDSSSPHLSGINGTRLFYVTNYDDNGQAISSVVNTHATVVTSIIAGQKVTVTSASGNTSREYEGIVPLATVYQTSIVSYTDFANAFNALVSNGVNIINCSAGYTTTAYHEIDEEIDAIVASSKVTFVKSAGNDDVDTKSVSSPGKALNAITVGNLATKSAYATALSSYAMSSDSRYLENSHLPNKPDICAPGKYIAIAKNTTTITGYSTGTSLSAPFITGIAAQAMQRVPSLKNNPYSAKAFIISCANNTGISATNNSSVTGNTYLRERSGAGLIDAIQITKAYGITTNTIKSTNTTYSTSSKTYNAGQKIKIVLCFGKNRSGLISNSNYMDNLGLRLVKESSGTNTTVVTANSSTENLEIIEYTIPSDGTYHFEVFATKIVDTSTGVPYALCWRTY
ncbi:MAG: S8 family serine peptidase [Oscillospiraceae bacterium]|nr:S8 family serine peptidase [Oscillospiraceae bacterium]